MITMQVSSWAHWHTPHGAWAELAMQDTCHDPALPLFPDALIGTWVFPVALAVAARAQRTAAQTGYAAFAQPACSTAPGPRRRPVQACNRQTFYCIPLYDSLGDDAIDYIIRHSGGRLV